MKKKIIYVFLSILAICVIICLHKKPSNLKDIPYDSEIVNTFDEIELTDYVISMELETKKLWVTNKKTGKKRALFNNPLSENRWGMQGTSVSGNSFMFMSNYKLYLYDIPTDNLKVIYEYPRKGYYLKVFDCMIIDHYATPEVREAKINMMFIAKGKIVIAKDTGIDTFDGNTTTTIVDGNYSVLGYRNGILSLTKKVNDSKNLIEQYEYSFETNKLTKVVGE